MTLANVVLPSDLCDRLVAAAKDRGLTVKALLELALSSLPEPAPEPQPAPEPETQPLQIKPRVSGEDVLEPMELFELLGYTDQEAKAAWNLMVTRSLNEGNPAIRLGHHFYKFHSRFHTGDRDVFVRLKHDPFNFLR